MKIKWVVVKQPPKAVVSFGCFSSCEKCGTVNTRQGTRRMS